MLNGQLHNNKKLLLVAGRSHLHILWSFPTHVEVELNGDNLNSTLKVLMNASINVELYQFDQLTDERLKLNHD